MSNPMIGQKRKRNSKLNLFGFITSIKEKFTSNRDEEKEHLLLMLKEAHADWQHAERFFDDTTESDLIDYAIYKIEATKTRYRYLVKQAKEKNITINL